MKRAVHLLDTLRFGGAESVALHYARLMSERGIGSVLCGRPGPADFERFASKFAGLEHRLSLRSIRRSDCIFIHSNRNLLKMFLLRPFFRRGGKQIAYIQHLRYGEVKFRMISLLINRLCTRFIRITPVTERLVERYIRVPSAYIPHFYTPHYAVSDRAAIRRALRAECGIPSDRRMALFTGALKPGKGVDEFLSLAARFSGDGRYGFIVVGDGPESDKIRSYPHKNLIWTGWQADVERWLIASDVYCFLSRREMMPMALIEAQTLGLPVAALSSEVNDYLLNGRTYGDIQSLGDALKSGRIRVCMPRNDAGSAAGTLWAHLRLRLLHIQVLPKLTGVQRISLEIFRSLPEEEYDKTILFGGPDHPQTASCLDRFRETGAKVLLSGNLRREINRHDGHAFVEIYRLCRRERFDIVHTHSTKPGIVGRIAARLAGVPLVVHTVHGVAFHRYVSFFRRVLYRSVEIFASFFSHRITLVSGYYRRYFAPFSRKTTVVHNGISCPEMPSAGVEPEDGTVRTLFVGRLEEAKDPLTLLRAFDRIVNVENRRNLHLTLVGDGSLEKACHDFILCRGLSRCVSMTGWQAEPVKFYGDHQIFCLSSIHESFGLCLLEAGACGLPVVATAVGGVPEVVQNGETGILVPPRDPDALADAILKLADDPLLRRGMGQNAVQRVRECFPAEKMTNVYKLIYNGKL